MKVTENAVRQDIRTLILLAGGTGSGKTESAMRLATGLADGRKFAVIDTENGRALHKADDYAFAYLALDEPFSPERYIEAMEAVAQYPVIVIDSGSHEYDGPGGVLDAQADEFERMGKREGARMSSWIEPKRRHKRFVQALLRSPAHVILCLRAEDKIEVVKDANGKTVVRPKETLTGTQGWVPIVEKRLPFEATISLLLLQDAPGVPVPIKLERRHADLIPSGEQLSEKTGRRLAAWARGTNSDAEPSPTAAHPAEGAGGSGTEPAPSASDTEPGPSPSPGAGGAAVGGSGNTVSRSTRDKPITEALATKLGMLIGRVRDDAGAVTTADLYRKLAEVRGVDLETLRASIPEDVRDADGVLHIGPALKTLTRAEGHSLVDWLAALEENAKAGAPA